ncbi:O-acetyl-ADP-ribose deacetylase [Luteolibacter sp. Populi]|uniref:O-acetyl-ADP-ribose deacetylase n=1 Tax=Luteolibacter sp. Populi TaxID=3230487 RepID=UPI00346730ED
MKAIQGDITKLAVDAIVNAANSSLLGGGGVDGAIHRAAGPELVHECRLLHGCKVGEAKITRGYLLPAKHVIHTVGPVWNGGKKREAELLASCYRRSLELAAEHSLLSIAFPAISTGIYGYPIAEATAIAVKTVREFVKEHPLEVTFCCFSKRDLEIYQAELAKGEAVPTRGDAVNRAIGCLVGLAVGDALGTTLEFKSPGSFEPIDDMVGGGPFHLKAGQWTDDTSMALCLAESLLECGGFDLRDQADQYVRWWQEGHRSATGTCFDIGNTVRAALASFIKRGDPVSGSTDRYSAGNGSIMRLAPVPIYFKDPKAAVHYSIESSRSTHQASACLDACRYLGGILWGLIHGATKQQVLAPSYCPEGCNLDGLDPAIAEIAAGSFKEKDPPQIRGSGYVVQSLEAALWAFHRSDNFRDGALLAVNLGDDADTTGAIYGQIAGACYGIDSIPAPWLEKLHDRELILDFAKRLFLA